MNAPETPQFTLDHLGPAEAMSVLFARMIAQHTNMALMFLGKVPHPETGQVLRDVDAAKMFIDQLEMLEVKTKGNLDKQEERLLKESLTALRMSFVEAVDADAVAASPPDRRPSTVAPAQPATDSDSASSPAEEESRKKFSKKY